MPDLTPDDPYAVLRRALEREYRLDTVLRETAEGAVYLGHDRALNRRAVIKAAHPELAGAESTEAIRREARVLAALSHPGVPSVHHAGPIEGFFHVVLEYCGPDRLEDRLRQGPLPVEDLVRLGTELLSALGAMHAAGLIHRQVSARTVIAAEGRWVLDGFARAGPALTDDDIPGDLRAAALLLAEAAGAPGGRPARRLPRAVRGPLRRALGADHWPSAAAFSAALARPRHRHRRWRRAAIAAGLVLALSAMYALRSPGWWGPRPPPPAPRELAIVPFVVDGGPFLDPLGSSFAPLLQLNLDHLPGLQLTSRGEVNRWWERQGREALGMDWADAARDLRVHWVAHGLIDRRPGNLLRVRLTLYDSLGNRHVQDAVHAPVRNLAALGDSVTLQIIRVVAPRADSLYEPVAGLASVPLAALKSFLQGEAAFARDAWALAQGHYEIALQHDSTFALAEWRLANVRRWRRLPYEVDLRAVYQRHADRFRLRDRLLIEALLEPDLEVRLTRLEAAVARLPFDGYARLLLGEELFHRGPLVGRGVNQAVPVMAAAVARDPSLALAWDHLVLAATRFGRRPEALEALARRRAIGTAAHAEDLDLVPFLELVYDERFVRWKASLRHRYMAWLEDPRHLREVEQVARMGTPWLDMPETQLRYSDLLLRAATPSAETHATAHEGKGLAYFALGRTTQALAELDSAAALLDTPEARLQQGEWRVIPAALGLPDVGDGDWHGRLEALVDDPEVGRRAAWALAMAAQSAGDTARARRWIARLGPGTPLRVLLEAREAAMRGDPALALARSDAVRLAFHVTRPPDVFAAAAYHLLRGDWFAALGDRARADGEWLWYEASDVEQWPRGPAQAGEVDAALGVFARLKRARGLLVAGAAAGDTRRACAHLERIRELWAGADAAMRPLTEEASALAGRCPG
jgi:tRNA A-37 threonylcarbamoyl transferase component Bud32/tetratricopeptide (TPR) repeat protein